MITESCFVCDKTIDCYSSGRPHGVSECPSTALYCETTGNYGSQIFDPIGLRREKIVFYVCDDCMSKKASKAKYLVDGDLMPFNNREDLTMRNLVCDKDLGENDFKLDRDFLYLSEVVFNAAKKLGVKTSLQMLSYNSVFPDAFPTLLDWTEEQVNNFMTKIDPNYVEDCNFKRGYGALGPK